MILCKGLRPVSDSKNCVNIRINSTYGKIKEKWEETPKPNQIFLHNEEVYLQRFTFMNTYSAGQIYYLVLINYYSNWADVFTIITKIKTICFTYDNIKIANNESLVNTQFYWGLPSHSTSVLYTIYVLRYRTTVKLCNVFRWETLTLISSCGKTFHVKLSISSLTCWFTNQKRGWVYDKLLLIHGFKY